MWWRTRAACLNRVTVTKRQHFLKSSCFSRSKLHNIIYFSKIFFTLSLNFSAEFGRFFQIVINSKVPEALAIKRTAAVKITPHENVK